MSEVKKFTSLLKRYGLTDQQISNVLKVLRTIWVAEDIGSLGATISSDFDNQFKSELDILRDLSLIDFSGRADNIQVYECTYKGERIAEEAWNAYLENIKQKIIDTLKEYPPRVIAFWAKFGIDKPVWVKRSVCWQHYIEDKYVPESIVKPLIEDDEIYDLITKIWMKLVEIDVAIEAYHNVTTGGGSLRERKYVLPLKALTLIEQEFGEIDFDLKYFGVLGVLSKYIDLRNKTRDEYINLLEFYRVTEEDVMKFIEKLHVDGITSRYIKGDVPFLILDKEKYIKYIKEEIEKTVKKVKDYLIKGLPPIGPEEEEITLYPEKPYENLMKIKQLLRNLHGSILILDKHFSSECFTFFKDINPQHVTDIKFLIGRAHLNKDFKSVYKAFKDEMARKNIKVEARLLNEEDEKEIHDRYLISENAAYNTPPWNTINKKLGHIKKIKNVKEIKRILNKYWARSKNILKLNLL